MQFVVVFQAQFSLFALSHLMLLCFSSGFLPKKAVSDVSQKYDVSHKGGYAQINLQYKPHKRATKLIVTILTDINACDNNISINNKREGLITSCLGG